MSINFYPCRTKMSDEIRECTAQRQLRVLQSYCSSCIYRIFEDTHVHECHTCEVRQGMQKILKKKTATPRESVESEEILGVC